MADIRHVAIAGAGIMGLACALELRGLGLRVSVFETAQAMRESSWAAGGMLAVEDPENPPALHPLSRYSRSLYDRFLSDITRSSGIPIPWRTTQTLQLIGEDHRGYPGHFLTPDEAAIYLPGLVVAGNRYVLLQEASLDPRDLCAALPLAVRAAGVELHEHQPVTDVRTAGAGVLVTTARGRVSADLFLNCCGAWSEGLLHAPLGAPGIAPRKGQMMVVAAPSAPPLTRVLRSAEVYLIPRGDGRIAIGATVEDVGYSKEVDAAALAMLRRRASALWPPIANAPLLESWAGLRPGTNDALPLIGQETPGDPARWLAAGHYRNGILLAPGTAACIAALIHGEPLPLDITPFAPHRTQQAPVCDKQFAPAL